jgi:hypothetical protein
MILVPDLGLTDAQTRVFGEASYQLSLPSTMLAPIALIYDDTQLDEMSLRELETYDSEWRNRVGSPQAFTWDRQSYKVAATYPSPAVASPPINTPHNDPWGQDYLPYQGLVIFSETRTNVLPYMELPLALRIMQQEFSRESNHQDPALAEAVGQIATLMFDLIS